MSFIYIKRFLSTVMIKERYFFLLLCVFENWLLFSRSHHYRGFSRHKALLSATTPVGAEATRPRGPKSLNFPDGNFQRTKTFRTKCVNRFRDKCIKKCVNRFCDINIIMFLQQSFSNGVNS